ncbi:MAG: hypothetical protein DRI46_00415 [Chloroflexi bacterium]|nr:MAG: hypothetical protein DRI46_00415 [Chloroflexota bacterium]
MNLGEIPCLITWIEQNHIPENPFAWYFITICTKEMKKLFGRIVNGDMILNRFGTVARGELLELQSTSPNVETYDDEFVIMTDHIHAILWITDVGASHQLARNTTFGLYSNHWGRS